MIKSYKGFDKDLKCRGMQYEVGKTFEEKEADLCRRGLHSCEYPLDVFRYYAPADSRYCETAADGDIDKEDNSDSKIASTKLHIEAEIGLKGIIEAGVKFVMDRVNFKDQKESNDKDQSAATNTGDQSAATNTGDQSAATNTGYQSAATNTGDQSAATVKGKESIAIATGIEGKAKGALGCWIVVAEWNRDEEYDWHLKEVKTAKVDGEKIKENTFYILEDGEFKEV